MPQMELAQLQRRQIRWILLLRVIIYSTLLGVSSILQVRHHELDIPSFSKIIFFMAFIFFFSIVSEFLLRKVTNIKLFTYIQILADSIFVTIIVYFTGRTLSIFAILYFFPVLSAGVILPSIGGMVLASINTILYSLVLFANHLPLGPYLDAALHGNSAPPNISFQALAVYGISFFLAATLSSILSERFSKTQAQLTSATHDLDAISRLYKQIFDDISSGIITVDNNGDITSFNKAAEEISGFSAHELIGRPIDRLFPELKSIGPKKERLTTKITKKDKSRIAVGYSWARLNLPDKGKNSRVYTLQDLSEIKLMEAKVQQAEKMAAIGEIAAGIAHEFRNPLAAISGATQILRQESDMSATNKSLLAITQRECDRLSRNINDFLHFSKPATPEKKWFALAAIVDECIQVVRRTPGCSSSCQITADLPDNQDCWADQDQLKQILINLIHNSCQAAGDAGRIEINSDESDSTLMIAVSDNGSGIKKEHMDSIFEPFFTTKENGTGLGLAIVNQIVTGHNGYLKIDTKPDSGTTIKIFLPLP